MNGDHPSVVRSAVAPRRLGPTAARLILGDRLRSLREARKITRDVAGKTIRASQSKVCRMELGQHRFKRQDVEDLLELYEVPEKDREVLFDLLKQANTPGWWRTYHDLVPSWFDTYLGLEQSAAVIRGYEVRAVHDLLQTDAYAHAELSRRFPGEDRRRIERRVELRLRRQRILAGPDGPHAWIILDEAAVRRPAGGTAVMRAQFDHLLELAEQPNIRVQVLPFVRGVHPASGTPMSLLRLATGGALPDTVFLEQMDHGYYPDRPADLDRYRFHLDMIATRATRPEELAAILHRVISER